MPFAEVIKVNLPGNGLLRFRQSLWLLHVLIALQLLVDAIVAEKGLEHKPDFHIGMHTLFGQDLVLKPESIKAITEYMPLHSALHAIHTLICFFFPHSGQ
jgi:hypothetical protein